MKSFYEKQISEMLVEDFDNPRFLRLFSERLPLSYEKAKNRSIDDPLTSKPSKQNSFGHNRHALTQSLFYESAVETETNARYERCKSNGYEYPIVTVGRFYFTLHYGSSPNKLTRRKPSLIRRQNSFINNELIQPKLFDKSNFDINKLRQADEIYAEIIHGCRGNGLNFDRYGFLKVSIPYTKESRNGNEQFLPLVNINLYEVLQELIKNESSETPPKPIIDTAIPKIRERRGYKKRKGQ